MSCNTQGAAKDTSSMVDDIRHTFTMKIGKVVQWNGKMCERVICVILDSKAAH